MKISCFTLGCKLNTAETDELKKDLIKLGHFVVPYDSEEEICIVRGCGVTCNASQKTRNIIRHIKRKNAYVIVAGCVENKDLEEIDFVGEDNEKILRFISSLSQSEGEKSFEANIYGLPNKDVLSKKYPPKDSSSADANQLPRNELRTRSFIKIQNGCNFNCAYCIIPSFRGKSTSVPVEEIINKINQAVMDGYKEIVLTGVNVCQYHYQQESKKTRKQENIDLANLLELILKNTKIKRIRLGSLDPRLISNKLINLYTQPLNHSTIKPFTNRLLPHFHLSLQSGSDAVLKNMNRNYTVEKYLGIIKKLRATNPLFSFTTDIIVGFPGETENDFKKTCDFVKQAEFAKVHVFPFSPRPGTMAENLPDQVPDKIKTERAKKLSQISNNVGKKFAEKFIGLEREVLIEHQTKNYWDGYTPEYLRVKIDSEKNLDGKIVKIKIERNNLLNG